MSWHKFFISSYTIAKICNYSINCLDITLLEKLSLAHALTLIRVGVHMSGSSRLRRETINRIKPIDFLFFRTEPPMCSNRTEQVQFDWVTVLVFFYKKMIVQLVKDIGL